MVPSRRRIAALLLAMSPALACNAILGIDERPATATSDGGGGTGQGGNGAAGTGGSACPTGTSCRDSAPDGWVGPVSFSLNQDPAGVCLVGSAILGGVGPASGPFDCAPCACGAAGNQACPTTADLSIFTSNNTSCTGGSSSHQSQTTCETTVLSPPTLRDLRGDAVFPTGGDCPASGGGATDATLAFSLWAHLCSVGPSPELCAEGVCAPAQGTACVYQAGQLAACPPGPYQSEPLVIATNIVDGRGCTPCACSAPSGGSCDGVVTNIYFDDGCAGGLTVVPHTGSCVTSANVPRSRRLDTSNITLTPGACTPSGGDPTGEVEVGEYLTLCCAQ